MIDIHFMDTDSDDFPPPMELQSADLAAIGSNLKPATLLKAYRKGYFPWYNEGEPRCWFNMDPRLVLFPKDLRIRKSMRPVINQRKFSFSYDKDFKGVIQSCRYVIRKNFPGSSWISDEIVEAYLKLFEMGYAHSAEAWLDGKLVGGLYGVQLGSVFFGESMFSTESNASKFAFIQFVKNFAKGGGLLIDCQQQTPHLASLGAKTISRKEFIGYLNQWIPSE